VGKETPLPPRAWKGERACRFIAAGCCAGSPAFPAKEAGDLYWRVIERV
jgi:hypothetical protein